MMAKKPLLSRKTQSTLITGVVVAFVGAWATHWFGPRPEPIPQLSIAGATPQTPAKPVRELLDQSRISFADWQAILKQPLDREQRNQIFERYRGERVTWQGYFEQYNPIRAEYGGSTQHQFILVMYEDLATLKSESLGRAPALCIFDAGAAEQLQRLKSEQRIVIQGTFADATLHGELLGTRLYKCELLEPAE